MQPNLQMILLVLLVLGAFATALILSGSFSGPRARPQSEDPSSVSDPGEIAFLVFIIIFLIAGWVGLVVLLLFYKTRLVQWPVVMGCVLLVLGTDRFVRLLDGKERSMVRKGDPVISLVLSGLSVAVIGMYMFSLTLVKSNKEKYPELAAYFEGKKNEADQARQEGAGVTDEQVRVLLERAMKIEREDPQKASEALGYLQAHYAGEQLNQETLSRIEQSLQ